MSEVDLVKNVSRARMKIEECGKALKVVLVFFPNIEDVKDYIKSVYRSVQHLDPVLFAQACDELSRIMTPYKPPLPSEYEAAYRRLLERRRAADPSRSCKICQGTKVHPFERVEVEELGMKYEKPVPCDCQKRTRDSSHDKTR